ncbi:MAG: UDP-N-acetylmuramoyl-L-alanyl-D-glutamate--2,6-diaminopimelate ligase [Candidatus Latescibacterota bacterium]|jgi:UDP-N-acetylmuramoyl-L-alanyl-D-glutamate--2,6-diaminopimelate ligase
MVLAELLRDLPVTAVTGSLEVEIGRIVCDSRVVESGDLFVAIRGGQEQDRHRFVPEAVARGARAVVVEEEVDTGAAVRVQVANCRRTLAELAARFHSHPAHRLELVGITGTKGKTTTALLVRQVFEAAGRPCGYLGTLGCVVGDELEKQANTTPEAPELHRLLRAMVAGGKRAAALEVSSHGLVLDRVAGLEFRVGLFTNLSRDHLDFHGTVEEYLAAKARLFEGLGSGAAAVINRDDQVAEALIARSRAPVMTYGHDPRAEVRIEGASRSAAGTCIELRTPAGPLSVTTPLIGGFNVYNATAAVAVGLAVGLNPEAIGRGIAAMGYVPGRFERISAGQEFEVIVDYAHTPDSLRNVLQTARDLTSGRLICVFGCGGNRDRGKRPQMGRLAAELADLVVLTSDNPRFEEPEAIIAEIAAGLPEGTAARVLPDRLEAIRFGLETATPGDLVLIAGKGHETVQILGDRTVPFDDREVARRLLAGASAASGGGR